MRWPSHATRWLDNLKPAKALAETEREGTAKRLAELHGVATTNPGPVGPAAKAAIAAGRAAMAEQMGQIPACLVVTPFQSGIGQGRGYQRFLSAPNLLQVLADKLPTGPGGYALAVVFLSTRYDQLAAALARFNALLPIQELQRAEKRARHLSRLEAEKWTLPSAASLPAWGVLPLERCTITQAAKHSLSGQLAALESYTADSSPMADLSALAARKAKHTAARDQQLEDLQEQLANPTPDSAMVARLVGPGSGSDLRRQLLAGKTPGHEWVLCAGFLLAGPREGLSFVQELVGL